VGRPPMVEEDREGLRLFAASADAEPEVLVGEAMTTKKSVIITASVTAALTAVILISMIFNPSGCAQTTKQVADPRPQIDAVKKTNQTVADVLPQRADRIDKSTDQITKTVPPKIEVQIAPHTEAIKHETAGLRQDAGQLQGTLTLLDQTRAAAEQLRAANGKLDATVTKLEAEKAGALRKLMASLIVLSVIGIGVSAALFATGNRIGITSGIGSLVTLVVAVIVSQYSFWLALSAAAFWSRVSCT
jgi:hypothetical protein